MLVVVAVLYTPTAPYALLAIAVAIAAGGLSARAAIRSLANQAERLSETADALGKGRQPPHVMPDGQDALSRAERQIVAAADTAVAEIDKLAEQRDEFEAILRSMTEAVVVTDARGAVVLLNNPARAVFALASDAPSRGRPFIDVCRDPRMQEFIAGAAASSDGQVRTAEISIQYPQPRRLSVSAAPVARSGAGQAAWVFVLHDITQLRAYETARSDFIANLTHEIRTPLAALYGYAETLARGVDDPDTQRRFLGIIERQSRRLSRLIDDLISLSELERGISLLKCEPVEPQRIVEESAELMREQAERAGLRLEVQCAPDLPMVSMDRDRIQQVMVNLLDNAIKYTPRGGSVTARARAAASNGAQTLPSVEFVVSDTGEGIPAADIPRLTERFYRVDRARSRELGGTGLGLAIVKHIVQLHRGTLAIESRVNEGTKVTVSIPAATRIAIE